MFDNNITKLSFLTVFLILGANLRERSEGSECIHHPPILKHFEAFLRTFSCLVQSLEFPRKTPRRLVSWSVGQFYIRRASHFTQNFYLYI